MNRPPFIELKLTTPRMENDTVAYVQDMINRRSPRYVRGLDVDGILGIHTGEEIRAFKYRMGWPLTEVKPAIGPEGLNIIWQWDQEGKSFPLAYRTRRIARLAVPFSLREGISPLTWRLLHPGSYPQPTSNAAAVDVALGWAKLGLREDPAGSNYVSYLSRVGFDLGAQARFANMRYAWCAYFFYLCHLKAGHPVAKAGLVDGSFWPLYTPTIESLALNGRFGHSVRTWDTVKPGNGVLFDWDGNEVDHIGMYLSHDSNNVTTVDGNTSGTGGNQSNGGMVLVRTRPRSTVQRLFAI